ncbi:MAG TPA: hypothetical protein VGN69_05735 [Solirubrobacteraceae bacterium]|jgi:hypothetical protein|nr:hypothetical protein [Solirubrobacteraceae bacterium]
MRAPALHAALADYCEQAADLLHARRDAGQEIAFDVVPASGSRRRGLALYCYRPLTEDFVAQHSGDLARLPSHASALRALQPLPGLAAYLRARGVRHPPAEPSAAARAALGVLLDQVFDQATDFQLSPERFERAYMLLEASVLEGQRQLELAAVVRGMVIAAPRVELGDGLELMHLGQLEGAPPELADPDQGRLIALWTGQRAESAQRPVTEARRRLRRLLTPLRLYGDAEVALEPLAWLRIDGGPWVPMAIDPRARALNNATIVAEGQEDELRAFCNLVTRRTPQGGELAWALRRFEFGCERASGAQALTDFLAALRALLEPEGTHSGRLAGRLAVLCAVPDERRALADRVLAGVELERALIAGLAPDDGAVEELADELRAHLQALLRDVLCGHLDSDLRAIADALIEQDIEAEYQAANAPDYDDPDAGLYYPSESTEPEPTHDLPAEPTVDLPAEPTVDLPAEPTVDLESEQEALEGDQATHLLDRGVQVGHDGR